MSWISKLLQVPFWLLAVASIVGGFYAAYTKIQGITYSTPIILIVIIALYVLGRYMESNKEEVVKEEIVEEVTENVQG